MRLRGWSSCILGDLLEERIKSDVPSFLDKCLVIRSRCGRSVKLLLVDGREIFSYGTTLARYAELVSGRRLGLYQTEYVGSLLAVREVLCGWKKKMSVLVYKHQIRNTHLLLLFHRHPVSTPSNSKYSKTEKKIIKTQNQKQ